MRQITPVFWGNRKPAYPCSIPLKSRTDLPLKYPNGNQQPCFLASFAINSLLFPLITKFGDGDRFGETASATRKSAQIDVISCDSASPLQTVRSASGAEDNRTASCAPPTMIY
jgi:hypothetical protein